MGGEFLELGMLSIKVTLLKVWFRPSYCSFKGWRLVKIS